MTEATTWIVTDGRPGMVSQVLGLAEALGHEIVDKRLVIRAPWRWLPPEIWLRSLAALAPESDRLEPPWPDILIGCGLMSIAPAIAVGRASGGRTFTVQLQKPAWSTRRFDLVVPPRHDRASGANVIVTRGALNRVTPARLAAEGARFRAHLAHLPRPLVAVLLGGDNVVYRFTERAAVDLGDRLKAMCQSSGASLAVTPSRRTGAKVLEIIAERLGETPAVIWDGGGANPYYGYLALADAVVATCDSVSMVSEAGATGKPIHVFDLEGGSVKFREFHRGLRRDGVTRPFEGRLEHWTYAPLDDTAQVAAEVRRRLELARADGPRAPRATSSAGGGA